LFSALSPGGDTSRFLFTATDVADAFAGTQTN